MKRDYLLELLRLIKNDEFISQNLELLFPEYNQIDYARFLCVEDEAFEHLETLKDSRLKFIQMYLYFYNKWGYVNRETILNKINNELDVRLINIIFGLIRDNYDDCKEGINYSRNIGEVIYGISNSSGIKQAEYAVEATKKLFKKDGIPMGTIDAIKMIAMSEYVYQSKYAVEFISKLNRVPKSFSSLVSTITHGKGEVQSKLASESAVKGANNSIYGLKLVEKIASSNTSLNAECVSKLIDKWKFFDKCYKTTHDEVKLGFIDILSKTCGKYQTLGVYEILSDDILLYGKSNVDILKAIICSIAYCYYDYQAKYATKVAKELINKTPLLVNKIVERIVNSKGSVQAEYASMIAIDESIGDYLVSLVDIVSNAKGGVQAKLIYDVIKNTNILDRGKGLDILREISNLDEDKCNMIVDDIYLYLDKLDDVMCLKVLKDDGIEETVILKDIMGKVNDLDLIIDVVSSIDNENLVDSTKVASRELKKALRKGKNSC